MIDHKTIATLPANPRVLVCGGRNYRQQSSVDMVLDALPRPSVIIHGAARGADTLAAKWAANRGIPTEAYPADWDAYGNNAGGMRNTQMLQQGRPHVVVAFPGGTGTANMIRQSRHAGIPVIEHLSEYDQ